ncbi:hypothetical protein [Mediterraneibacter agrestimuris]|uniref:hypothetical protein n=1 Tax=Mediterraneibacter agrestimuris TaxID=2941333 RepID=UPI002041CB2A|nr:hypothetical protein [Mediterraneibacter agrestimuris]
MTEKHLGDQLSTKEAREKTISEAVRLVNAEIEAVRKRLEDISQTEEASPILVEGETSAGYFAQIMASPSEVAKIMLKYDYHFWNILEQDAPDNMWLDIAEMVGLESVSSVDISLKPKHQNEDQLHEHKN